MLAMSKHTAYSAMFYRCDYALYCANICHKSAGSLSNHDLAAKEIVCARPGCA